MAFHQTKRARVQTSVLAIAAAAVVASPIGCADEFSSCEDTLTCEEQGGEGGAVGEAGEGGGGASSGASPGGADAGQVGGGGTGAEGGEAADGGTAGDGTTIEPLMVIDISPASGTDLVERDAQVVITFSTEIDPVSVDGDSVSISSERGPLAGTLQVDGTEVSFTPEEPLPLLTSISINVTEDITSVDGMVLPEAFSSEFVVRDGRFGTPTKLFQPFIAEFASNDRGDLLAWDANTPSVFSFRPDEGWSGPVSVPTGVVDVPRVSAAVDSEGNAIVVISGADRGGGWRRYSVENGWGDTRASTPALALPSGNESVALLDDGTAVLIRSTSAGVAARTLGAAAADWSAPQVLAADGMGDAIHGMGNGAVAVYFRGNVAYARILSVDTGWGTPRALNAVGETAPFDISIDTRDARALITWLSGGVRATIFDGAAWGPILPVSSVRRDYHASAFAGEHVLVTWDTAGTLPDTLDIRARRYTGAGGWAPETVLGSTISSSQSAAAIDEGGVAFAAWADGGGVTYRRQRPGGTWTAPRRIEALEPGSVGDLFAFDTVIGDIMLLWSSDDFYWAARFE